MAAAPGGDFVVVWNTEFDGNVLGQRFDRYGSAAGDAFYVNTRTSAVHALSPTAIDVAMDRRGDFVVVWGTYDVGYCDFSYTAKGDAYLQRFSRTGELIGTEERANYAVCESQGERTIAAASDAAGRFVVAYDAWYQAGCGYGCGYPGYGWGCGGSCEDPFAALLSIDPSAQRRDFSPNTYRLGWQGYRTGGIAAAARPAGGFIVVWSGRDDAGADLGVSGQRIAADTSHLGTEFAVNTDTSGYQGSRVAVAADASGDFIVAWTSETEDGDGSGVFARRYEDSGEPKGTAFQVNTYTTGDQGSSDDLGGVSVAADHFGRFGVAWTSDGPRRVAVTTSALLLRSLSTPALRLGRSCAGTPFCPRLW